MQKNHSINKNNLTIKKSRGRLLSTSILKERLKLLLGAAGHKGGLLDDWRASRLGKGSKNPYALSRFCAGRLHQIRPGGLKDACVMEYGAGFLMAEPLLYSLYKAKRVDAVDYLPILKPKVLKKYVKTSDWEEALVYPAKFHGQDWVQSWFERLTKALDSGNDNWWEDLGINYIAPYNILEDESSEEYDLIRSSSTLEHVPPSEAEAIVQKMALKLRKGGLMHHYIHLEDHRDFKNDPFAFLSDDSDYQANDFDIRGNRLRLSDWRRIFDRIPNFKWKEYPHPLRDDVVFPEHIHESFKKYDREDLMASHLTILGEKLG